MKIFISGSHFGHADDVNLKYLYTKPYEMFYESSFVFSLTNLKNDFKGFVDRCFHQN